MSTIQHCIYKSLSKSSELIHYKVISKIEGIYLIFGLLVLRRMECLYIDSIIEESNSDRSELYKYGVLKNFYYNDSSLSIKSLSTDINNIELNFDSYLKGYHPEVRYLVGELNLSTTIKNAKRENKILKDIFNEIADIDLSTNSISRYSMDNVLKLVIHKIGNYSLNLIPADIAELIAKLTLENIDAAYSNKESIIINDDSFGTGDLLIGLLNQLNYLGFSDDRIIITGMEPSTLNYSIGLLRIILYGYDTSRLMIRDCITNYNNSWEMGHTYSVMKPKQQFPSWIKIFNKEVISDNRFKAGIPKDQNSFYMYLQHVISTLPTKDEIRSRACLLSTPYPLLEKKGNRNNSVANIRKWLLDNDYLEGIIKLPEGLFYESSIVYYIWIIDKNKNLEADSKRYIKFLDASRCCERIRPNIFSKTNQLEEEHIEEILKLYTSKEENTSLNKVDIKDISLEGSWLSYFNSID